MLIHADLTLWEMASHAVTVFGLGSDLFLDPLSMERWSSMLFYLANIFFSNFILKADGKTI